MTEGNFRKFLSADLISQFGAGMTMSAMDWYVLDKTGRNEMVALVFGINVVSGLIMSILSGAIVDRFSRKAVVISSLILRAILIAIPMVLLAMFGFNKYFVFILALNNGLGWNLYFPASKGLLQEITSENDLLKMNSGAEMTMQIGLFSAGAIAGALYKIIGFNAILLISTVTMVLGVLIVKLIKVEDSMRSETTTTNFIGLFKEGVSYLSSNGFIFLLGLTMYIPFVAASCYSVALPGFVNQLLKGDSITFGLVSMVYGIGACIAGISVIALSKKISNNKLIIGGFLTAIACGLLMFLTKSIIGAFVITFIVGICGPGIRTILYSTIMKIVPKSYLGRTMSVWNVISLSLQLVGTYAIGKTMDNIGASYGFLVYSVIIVIGLVTFKYSNKLIVKKEFEETAEVTAP